MITDLENNDITLADKYNPHLLVLGKSGSGKTYFSIRNMESLIESGKSILVIDYSHSYSENELHKAKFKYENVVEIYNLKSGFMPWLYDASNEALSADIADSIIAALNIRSYNQTTILHEACFAMISDSSEPYFSFEKLYEYLEYIKEYELDCDRYKNIEHLLVHFRLYKDFSQLCICNHSDVKPDNPRLCIIQLSDFPEVQKEFLTNFILEMYWKEIQITNQICSDVLLLDEFQHLEIKKGSVLKALLKESRKMGLKLILCTQSVAGYDRDALSTLFQCGNLAFFRPDDQQLTTVVNYIEPDNTFVWRKILKSLKVGSFVLKGSYILNGCMDRLYSAPLICNVEEIL